MLEVVCTLLVRGPVLGQSGDHSRAMLVGNKTHVSFQPKWFLQELPMETLRCKTLNTVLKRWKARKAASPNSKHHTRSFTACAQSHQLRWGVGIADECYREIGNRGERLVQRAAQT
jgi:hypothetical protein